MRAAARHLARFSASASGLRAVLVRRVRRASPPDEAPPDAAAVAALVDPVIEALRRQGLLDDAAFARGRLARLAAKGQPAGRIRRHLVHAHGVDVEAAGIDEGLAALDPLAQATRWAERRRLGPFRRVPRPDKRAADIGSLVRAGFPASIAIRVIDKEGRARDGGEDEAFGDAWSEP